MNKFYHRYFTEYKFHQATWWTASKDILRFPSYETNSGVNQIIHLSPNMQINIDLLFDKAHSIIAFEWPT